MIPPVPLILVHLIYLSAICTHARTHSAHAHHHFRCFLLKRLVFLRARSTIVKRRGPDNCSLQSCFVGDNRQKESERENLQRCTRNAAFLWRRPRAPDSVIDEVTSVVQRICHLLINQVLGKSLHSWVLICSVNWSSSVPPTSIHSPRSCPENYTNCSW